MQNIFLALALGLFVSLPGCDFPNLKAPTETVKIDCPGTDIVYTETDHGSGVLTLQFRPSLNFDQAGEVLARFKNRHGGMKITALTPHVGPDYLIVGYTINTERNEK